jgi:hypothetical protein
MLLIARRNFRKFHILILKLREIINGYYQKGKTIIDSRFKRLGSKSGLELADSGLLSSKITDSEVASCSRRVSSFINIM